MLRLRVAALVAAVGLLAPASLAVGAEPDPCDGRICAGAGKADMTPPVGVPMGGFFSRSATSGAPAWLDQFADRGPDPNLYAKTFRQTEGIHTPMHTRALVVQGTDGRRYAFASVENRGEPYELHQAVAARLAEADAGIPAERLLFSSTHSHSAPSPITPYTGYGLISADFFDPRVFEIVVDSLTQAILDGVARLEPARIGIGQTELHGASRNRSMDQLRRNPEIPDDVVANAPPAIDPTLTVLRAESDAGRPIGAFFIFALHGTTLGDSNNLFSGDNMGPAMRFCESALGERAAGGPAPVCAQANGAEGDISPDADTTGLWVEGGYARAERTGRQVADAVAQAWDTASVNDDVTLDSRFHVLYFRGQDGDPGEATSPLPMVGVGGNFGDGVGFPTDVIPGQGNKVPIPGPGGYPMWAPIQVIRVGDTALLSVPGEMTTTMARRIRSGVLEAAPMFHEAVVVGLANAYVSYMTTAEEYAANHYEGAWSLYGPQEGNLIRNELVRLAADLDRGVHGDYEDAPPFGELLGAEPTDPLRPDAAPAILVDPPASVERGEVVVFTWIGGNPAVDRPRAETFVRLERADGTPVATEDDTFSAVRVDRDPGGAEHRWTAFFDLPLDLPPGDYRIRVEGRSATPGGSSAYTLSSKVFSIVFSVVLEPEIAVDGDMVTVRGLWPRPEGTRFAVRPREAEGEARVDVIRGGSTIDSFVVQLGVDTARPVEPGDVLRIASGDLRDTHGNVNGQAYEREVE